MTKEQKQKLPVLITAIIAVTILETIALVRGIDGAYFGMAIAAIMGAAGFLVRGFIK